MENAELYKILGTLVGATVGTLALLVRHILKQSAKQAKDLEAERRTNNARQVKDMERVISDLRTDITALKFQIDEHAKALYRNTISISQMEKQMESMADINVKLLGFFSRSSDKSEVAQLGKDTFLVRKPTKK